MIMVNVTNHPITILECSKLTNDDCSGRIDENNSFKDTRCCFKCPYKDGGTIRELEPSGYTLMATSVQEKYKKLDGIEYMTLDFKPNNKSKRDIKKLDEEYWGEAIFIGSIITAQAFPEKVVAAIPVPGYERVPLNKKLVRSDKFTIYLKKR